MIALPGSWIGEAYILSRDPIYEAHSHSRLGGNAKAGAEANSGYAAGSQGQTPRCSL